MITPASKGPSLASFLGSAPDLVDRLLEEQRSLTAVERFSARHDAGLPDQAPYYKDLLPLRDPAPGEQFGFEVDLDRCSGCKACVTACHSLNGLDEGETWRAVGLLHETKSRPVQQHVTTACHHCAEPGCAQGCPVLAYEKDAITGIVTHLDDQCIGCQYCILKCPYDVPQYHEKKGIVRKCDMCVGRLRAGEAPACVQACPTQAIRITIVDLEAIRRDAEASFNLPGAPDAAITLPTTRYVSPRGLAPGLVPVNAAQVRTEHAHWPLVLMLTASQAAAGYWIVDSLLRLFALSGTGPSPLRMELIGFAAVFIALNLSLFHLGRPLLAWKAFLGWRRSWLSREVIAFSALAGTTAAAALAALATAAAGASLLPVALPALPAGLSTGIRIAVLAAAAAAVYASAMVYRDTPRPLWATRLTLWRFSLTAALGGIPAWMTAAVPEAGLSRILFAAIPVLFLAKLFLETRVFRHADDEDFGPLWKTVQLLRGPLGLVWRLRLFAGIAGGIALPLLAAVLDKGAATLAWSAAIFVLVSAGELAERYLFFTTGVAPRMPGAR
jgi:formate dehydrogenase iron-sulfur subunit